MPPLVPIRQHILNHMMHYVLLAPDESNINPILYSPISLPPFPLQYPSYFFILVEGNKYVSTSHILAIILQKFCQTDNDIKVGVL